MSLVDHYRETRAKFFPVSRPIVRAVIPREGESRDKSTRRPLPLDPDAVKGDWMDSDAQKVLEEASRKHGTTVEIMTSHEQSPYVVLNAARFDAVCRLHVELGYTPSMIAKAMNRAPATIRYLLKKAGLIERAWFSARIKEEA